MSTFDWEVAGSNPIVATFVFFINLILARRGMHVGMGFAGRRVWERQGGRNGNGRTPGMGMCFVGRGNGNGRTRNGSLPLTVLISSREFSFFIFKDSNLIQIRVWISIQALMHKKNKTPTCQCKYYLFILFILFIRYYFKMHNPWKK
jgi:hypothetical protein